jgi:predicted RNase H-like nuclease
VDVARRRGGPRAVLGIDAAWTLTQPTGVAAAVETEVGWRLAAVEASYERFMALANGLPPSAERPRGSKPNVAALLEAGRKICSLPIDLVAIDIPLARHPITGRRPSDIKVSKGYGARGAATHSPSAERPGKISDTLRLAFEDAGYPLRTLNGASAPAKALIEVYPHPALIEFLKAPRRLEYKAAKAKRYWPGLPLAARRDNLREVWRRIVEALERRTEGVQEALPDPGAEVRGWRLKAYEDKLDAVVCATVAIACLRKSGRRGRRRLGDLDPDCRGMTPRRNCIGWRALAFPGLRGVA